MTRFLSFQYHIGQLFMIAKHSAEQSHGGEGVEVVENRPHEDPVHGKGQYTETRIHLSRYGGIISTKLGVKMSPIWRVNRC